MGVHKDSELGSDGDFDWRRASPSLVIGREAGDPAGGFGAWIIGWGRGASARHQPVADLSVAPAFRSGRLRSESFAVVDFLPVEVCSEDEAGESPVDEEVSSGCMVSIELRHDRTLRFPSTLPCHEIQRLVVAVESA